MEFKIIFFYKKKFIYEKRIFCIDKKLFIKYIKDIYI